MEKKINFYQTPIQRELLLNKIRNDNSFKRIFKQQKNLTESINQDLHQRMNGMINQFYTMHIRGSQGSMKTSVGMTIASKFDPTFTANRISFQYEEHEEKFSQSQPKQTYQLDEQCFKHGTGSRRLIEEIQEKIELLRKRQNSLIIISPEKKYFPEELFTYNLETIDNALIATCPKNKKPHEPRNCTCYMNQTAQITRAYVRCAVKVNEQYIGFYIAEITWNNQIHQEYEKAKDTFMQQITEGKKRTTDYEKIAHEILQQPETEEYMKNKKTMKLLVQKHKPNLTIQENDLVVESIRLIKERGY